MPAWQGIAGPNFLSDAPPRVVARCVEGQSHAWLEDVSHEFVFSTRRRTRRWLVILVLLPCLALIVGTWLLLFGGRLQAWYRGEADLHGNRQYRPPHPVDRARLARTDMSTVHRLLLPRWGAAVGRDHFGARHAIRTLRREVGDPNLLELLEELHELGQQRPHRHASRIFYLTWAYNTYMDHNRLPWQLEIDVYLDPRPRLLLKTYHVLHELKLQMGDARFNGRLLMRADHSGPAERSLGRAGGHQEGAQVIVDRVHEVSVDWIWPMMDPEVRPADQLAELFGARIREEARRALRRQAHDTLRRTAADRATLIRVVRTINGRQCSSFRIHGIPHDGLNAFQLARIIRTAKTEKRRVQYKRKRRREPGRVTKHEGDHQECPAVTMKEADRLTAASVRLQHARGLRRSLGALLAWVSRGVMVHEARHAADDLAGGHPQCRGCPDELGRGGEAELSAYLASFADEKTGNLNLYQACLALALGLRGGSGAAIRLASRKLGYACRRGPHEDLYRTSGDLERSLLGRSEAVVLDGSFPDILPLPER